MSSMMTSQLTPQELQFLSNYSVLPPPEGVSPEFTNSPSHGKSLIIVTTLLLCIATIFILNRVYMKTFIARKYMLDDLTIMLGMTGAVAYYAATVIVQRGRLGVHEWNINIPQTTSNNLQIPAYLLIVLTPLTFLFIKLTFFIMYRQVFGPMRWMRINVNLGAIFTTLSYISMAVCLFIFATPRRGETWFSSRITSSLELQLHISVLQAALGLVIDVYILILPIVAVSKLQMATRRKVGIILIFTTGFLACLGSILSIYYRIKLDRTKDYTWVLIPATTLALSEMFIGISCACMPAAARTCHHHLPSYDSVKNNLRSRYESLEMILRGTNSISSSSPGNKSHDVNTTRGIHGGYVNLGEVEHDLPVAAKLLQTFIHSGRPDDLNYDGIHLTYEMQQTSASPRPHNRELTAV